MTFHSFDRWLMVRCPVARSTGYKAKRAVEAGLEAGVPVERMMRIHRTNLDEMATLSLAVRRDEVVLQAAETETHEGLVRKLDREYPEQHREGPRKMILNLARSARLVADDAIAAAEALHDLECREAAVEFICAAWLNAPCELEQFAGLSNLQAFQAAPMNGHVTLNGFAGTVSGEGA